MSKPKRPDPGEQFGKWTVMSQAVSAKDYHSQSLCRCECGHEQYVINSRLRLGSTQQCRGCQGKEFGERNKKEVHQLDHYLYPKWLSMINRCYNKDYAYYQNYGGSGITVCEEWRHKFLPYMEYVEAIEKPEDFNENWSLNRIDTTKGYEPGNLKWSDKFSRARNRRGWKLCTSRFKGVSWSRTRKKWCACININGKSRHTFFDNELDAACYYDRSAVDAWGEDALLNFPDDGPSAAIPIEDWADAR